MEQWKDIPGFENKYQISNTGAVKSSCRNKEIIMSPALNTFGYPKVGLYKDSKYTSATVHRLVAEAFIDNPDNKPQINHIDGNKANNNVSNLEWCTNSENMQHAWRERLCKPQNGSTNGMSKLTEQDVLNIRADERVLRDISAQYGVNISTISNIKNRKLWLHI